MMIKTLENFWAPISIVLIFAILASLFLWPAIAQPLMWIVIIFGTSVAVILAVNRHYRKYLQGNHDRMKLVRNVSLDVLGILLAIGGAIWLAGIVAARVVPAAANAIESVQPGMGYLAGIVAGLISALAVGLGVGFLVRWVWGKLMARLS
jgi:hypothetical protein